MSDANPPEHDLVKIQGLKARSDLNGLFASIVNKEPRNGRIVIQVCSTDERVSIKSENVTPITTEWIEGEEGHPYSAKYGTEQWYKSVDGARRLDPGAECYIVTVSNGKKFETWTTQWFGPRDGPKSTKRKGKEDEGEEKEVYADELLNLSKEEREARIALNTEKLKRMSKTDPQYDELDLETYTLRRFQPDFKEPAKRKAASIEFLGGDQDFSDDDDDEVDYRTPKFEDDDKDNVDYRTPKFEDAGDDSVVYRSVPVP
jgi:hypothetical protein